MPLLVRKIDKAKWMQRDILGGQDVSADAITQCTRTKDNCLSVWEVYSASQADEAVLAMASNFKYLETIDIVLLDKARVKQKGLTVNATPGDTLLEEFIDRHCHLADLTYQSLGSVAQVVIEAFQTGNIKRLTKAELQRLLTDAVKHGRIEKSKLEDKVKKHVDSGD